MDYQGMRAKIDKLEAEQEFKVTFRGWQGHFYGACQWHLNTLIERGDNKIVVSTVGQYAIPGQSQFERIGATQFETMVFMAQDNEWNDTDVSQDLGMTEHWDSEKEAQAGHYEIIEQVKKEVMK